MDLILRSEKTVPLTFAEMDSNLQQIEDAINDLADTNSTVLVGGEEAGKLAGKVYSVVSVLDFIPQSEWAAILNYSSTYDASDAFQAAMNSNSYVHVFVPQGKYRITKTLNVVTQVTLTGPDGGSQSMQHARIYHDPVSTGRLFDVTTLVSGVCIKNLFISGGNGSTCIVNTIPQARYEFLYWNEYNGGGIQLRSDGVIGASSLRIKQCEWLGINAATNHIGFDIDCNGGDVHLEGLVAIRGSVGINIVQGQTIRVIGCSVNKQSTFNSFSSRPDSQTAGIRLSGAGYKESILIDGCYVEACTNGIYVEGCQSLAIKNNLLQDVGVAGVVGAWERFNNHSINIVGTGCQNVTIENNFIRADSNGKSGVDTFYALNVGSGVEGLNLFNNNIRTIGDVSAQYRIQSKVNSLSNKYTVSSNPRPNIGTALLTELNVGLKAFAKFNGVGGVSATNYYGITSVTRVGAGEYTVVTSGDWPNAAVSLTAENGSVLALFLSVVIQTADNTFSVFTGSGFSTLADARQISFIVHG